MHFVCHKHSMVRWWLCTFTTKIDTILCHFTSFPRCSLLSPFVVGVEVLDVQTPTHAVDIVWYVDVWVFCIAAILLPVVNGQGQFRCFAVSQKSKCEYVCTFKTRDPSHHCVIRSARGQVVTTTYTNVIALLRVRGRVIPIVIKVLLESVHEIRCGQREEPIWGFPPVDLDFLHTHEIVAPHVIISS